MGFIQFKKIRIQNFLCFGDEIQEYNFKDKGFSLILGINKDATISNVSESSNGSGKTSFINALFWALFGETDKKIKADDVVNNINQRDCFVGLDFIVDNNYYRIERYRNHRKHKNALKLYRDKEDITQSSNVLTQQIIDKLVGDSNVFLNSIIFSQEQVVNFLKLRSFERKQIIEKILQLERLTEIQEKLKNKVKILIEKRDNYIKDKKNLELKIKTLENNLQNYLIENEKKINSIKQEIEKINKKINFIEKINIEEIKNKKQEYEKLNEEYKNYKLKLQEKENLLKNYLFLWKEKKDIRKKIDQLNSKIEEYLKNPSICPVCGNIINKEKFEEYINSLKKENEENLKEIENINIKQKEIKEEIKKSDLLSFKIKTFYNLNQKLSELKKTLDNFQFDISKLDEIENLKFSLQIQKTNLEENLKNITAENFIENTKKEIKENENKLPYLSNEIKEFDEEIKCYEFWLNALDIKNDRGINNYILSLNLPIINQRLENYILSIFNYPIKVIIDSQFNEKIYLKNKEINYNNLSGGEKKRLDLAINLTLFDLVRLNFNKTNILIMDEILDQLDKEGQKTFLNILKTISENYSVYLISHSAWINDFNNLDEGMENLANTFDEIIIVEKSNGFSKLKLVGKI